MQQVIDDINAEWAPEAFNGRHWSPSIRPWYMSTVPKKDSPPDHEWCRKIPSVTEGFYQALAAYS